MKKNFYFSVLILSALLSLFQGVAHADDNILTSYNEPLQATPYPTLTPIGATTTPYNLITPVNFNCPAGTPVGFGTVTPSIDWQYACGHCYPTSTPPPFYTSTIGPTHTPALRTSTPTCEGECPTLTPTVTVSPTSTPVYDLFGSVWIRSKNQSSVTIIDFLTEYPSYAFNDGYRFGITGLDITGLGYSNAIRSVIEIGFSKGALPLGQPIYVYFEGIAIYTTNTDGVVRTMRGSHAQGAGGVPLPSPSQIDVGADNGQQVIVNYTDYSSSFVIGASNNYEYDFNLQQMTVTQNFTVDRLIINHLEISTIPISAGTPTPTPTSAPTAISDYCSTVSSSNVPNLFEFGGGNIVHQECFWTPELSPIDFLDFFVPAILEPFIPVLFDYLDLEVSIPPITICVRSRDYSLYLFGFRMPIELVIGLGIFLSGLRLYLPTMFSGASVLGSLPHSSSPTYKSGGWHDNGDGSRTRITPMSDGQSNYKETRWD